VHMSQIDLTRDVLSGTRVIARYHHDSYACAVALFDRGGNVGAHRICQSHQAQKLEVEVMLQTWQLRLLEARLRHAQYAKPFVGKSGYLDEKFVELSIAEVAQVENGFWRPFRGDYVVVAVARFPYQRQRQQLVRQR